MQKQVKCNIVQTKLVSFMQLFGRASFAEADLKENFDALLDAIVKAKPAAAKGQYLKKVAVSSTMGLGVRVDTSSVNN